MKELTSSVEAIEVTAEKILQEARGRANEILLKAKEEAKEVLAYKLPMDEVRTERDEIITKARVEAEAKIADSEKKASEIRANADKKVEEVTERVVRIITGRS